MLHRFPPHQVGLLLYFAIPSMFVARRKPLCTRIFEITLRFNKLNKCNIEETLCVCCYIDTDLGSVPYSSGHESSLPPLRDGASPGVKLPGMELQATEAPQRQLKAQKRRVPPPSKVLFFYFLIFMKCRTKKFGTESHLN